MLPLPDLQRAFFRGIARAHQAEDESGAPSAILSEIRGDDRLGAEARVEVYARMYCARLIDALAEDYPRVAAALGGETFGALAHDYVTAHPSTHPSLRWFGREFADFLARRPHREFPRFVCDLARLEWARLAVFDAPDDEVLTLDALRRLPPDDWANLRLRLTPAVEILQVAWPVHQIWEDDQVEAPRDWQSSDTWLRVWRQADKVYQASLDLVERAALMHVQAGETFAALCAGVAAVVGADVAAATAGALVLRWVDDGVLRGGESFPISRPGSHGFVE